MQRLEDERSDLDLRLDGHTMEETHTHTKSDVRGHSSTLLASSYSNELHEHMENSFSTAEINHLQDDCKVLHSNIQQLEDKKHDLEMRLKEKEMCLSDVKKENDNRRRKELEATMASYAQKLESAENALCSKEHQVENLNSDLDRLNSVLMKSQKENDILRCQVKDISEDTEKKLREAELTIKKSEEENTTLETRIRVLTNKIEMNEKDKRERRLMDEEKTNELRSKFEKLEQEHQELLRHVRSIEGSVQIAKDLEAKLILTQEKNDEKISELNREKTELRNEVDRLSSNKSQRPSSYSTPLRERPSTPSVARERSSSPMPYSMNGMARRRHKDSNSPQPLVGDTKLSSASPARERLPPAIETRSSSHSSDDRPPFALKGPAEKTPRSKYSSRTSMLIDNSDNESTAMSVMTARSNFSGRIELSRGDSRVRHTSTPPSREKISPPKRKEFISSLGSVHCGSGQGIVASPPPTRGYDNVERMRDAQMQKRSTPPPPPPPPPPIDVRQSRRGSSNHSILTYNHQNFCDSPGHNSLASTTSPRQIYVG